MTDDRAALTRVRTFLGPVHRRHHGPACFADEVVVPLRGGIPPAAKSSVHEYRLPVKRVHVFVAH